MKEKRYTEGQVLCGLRDVWFDATGNDDPIDADTSIYEFMKEDGSWAELDFAEIFRRIEGFFGFDCSNEEWMDFWGNDVGERSFAEWEEVVAPKLTFGALARFIAERAPVVAWFDSISIVERDCAPAGAFLGIQQVAENTTGKELRFGPSSRISEVMQGRNLSAFWGQLRWMTEEAVPELPGHWSCVIGCLGVFATGVALVASCAETDRKWLMGIVLVAVLFYLVAWACKRFTNPLPSPIVTFRDLAMIIAHR